MLNILIAFASMSGNTEELALLMEENLTKSGAEVITKQIGFDKIEIEELTQYDGILIGTYTDGDGDLPYETEDFFDDLDTIDLTGKPVALFGSCDSLYPCYGGAVDQFEDKLTEKGAIIVVESLKVELSPDKEDENRCRIFTESLSEMIARQHSLPGM